MSRIVYDNRKRLKTLIERGLDFADANQIFAGPHSTREDARQDYGEPRFQTFGIINDHPAMIVWTPRGEDRRIISMRYAHEQEIRNINLG